MTSRAEKCIAAVKGALGDQATDDQVTQVVEALQSRAASLRRQDPLLSPDQAAVNAARQLGDEAKLAALIEQRSRSINVLRKQQRFARYERDFIRDKGVKAAQEIMVGSQRGIYGAANSVDAIGLGVEAELVGPMIAELRRGGLFDLIRKGGKPFQRDVARELFRLTNPAGTASENKLAVDVARILGKYQEKARQLQNDAGAWIGKLDGYVTRQSHDQYRIRKAGYDAWRAEIGPKLDPKTFDGVADPEKFLQAVYAGLASGLHVKHGGDWLAGFKGPGNLAKKASQERVLHFRDADSWFAYNEAFGTRDLFESALGGLTAAARNTALMRVFGTNPEAAFVADMQQLSVAARDAGDFDAAAIFNGAAMKQGQLGMQFKVISGETNIIGAGRWSPTIAGWSSGARAIITMAKLGGVVLSSMPDIAVRASALRHHGVPYLAGIADGLKSIGRGRGQSELREIGDLIGVGLDGTIGQVFARFSAHDTVPGRLSKTMNIFMRANLLSFWTDAQSFGVGTMLARHAANAVRKGEWSKIGGDLQRSLARYGIGEAEWNALRQAELRSAEGDHFLTPDQVEALSDEAVLPLAAARIDQLSSGLAARTAKRLAADAREQQWADGRVAKLQERFAKSRDWLDRVKAKAEASNARLDAGLQARMDLLQTRLELAIWESDLRQAGWRRDSVAAAQAGQAVGRRIGRNEGSLKRRIVELEQKIRSADKKLQAQASRRGQAWAADWAEKDAELRGFLDEMAERKKLRAQDQSADDLAQSDRVLKAIDRARQDLATKLRAYYVESTREAMTMAGAYERAITTAGKQRGTVLGEAIRFVMQFKAYGVTFTSRHIGRELRRKGSVDFAGLGALIVGTTALGYASLQAKEMAKGRSPRTAKDAAGWRDLFIASMVQGGGFGIYGDFLFGEYNRFGGGAIETLSGPAVGEAGAALKIIGKIVRGEWQDLPADATRFAKDNTPFINLFYTRQALDWLVLYDLQEAMSPGYLQRMERRIKKENGQKFLLSPSQDRLRPFTR